MGKGTPSFGKRGGKATHIRCRRCGRRSYHHKDNRCSACGFGQSKKIKRYSWRTRSLNRERLF